MEINTILGLTINQIEWMKRYFIEGLIEIPTEADLQIKYNDKRSDN